MDSPPSPRPPAADPLRDVPDVVGALRRATSVLFVTGAGISTDSGLPTYRGAGGLYDGRTTDDGIPIEEAMSGRMLMRRPEITWRHLMEIERACRGARPNRGHEIIARFEREFGRVWVLTQNIDGFHRGAGSRNVIEIHGNRHLLHCTRCPRSERVDDYAGLGAVPRCPECGGLIRPAVVLFGEMLPEDAIETLEEQLALGFDVVFSIGTTSVFPYIAAPVFRANRAGATTVEINPGETGVSGMVTHRIRTGATPALEAILGGWLAAKSGP